MEQGWGSEAEEALRNGVMPNRKNGTDFRFWRIGLRLGRLWLRLGILNFLLGEAAAASPGALAEGWAAGFGGVLLDLCFDNARMPAYPLGVAGLWGRW
jgi:hypothetical protein